MEGFYSRGDSIWQIRAEKLGHDQIDDRVTLELFQVANFVQFPAFVKV